MLAVPLLVVALAVGAWMARAHAMTGRFVFVNSANSENVYQQQPWTPLYRTWWFGSHKHRGDPGVPDGFVDDYHDIGAHAAGERDRLFMARALESHVRRPDLFAIRTVTACVPSSPSTPSPAPRTRPGEPASGPQRHRARRALYLLPAAFAILAAAREMGGERDRAREATMRLLLKFSPRSPYATPYSSRYASHPTYHLPVLVLAAVPAAGAAVRAIEGGLAPLWASIPRHRAEPGSALAALGALLAIHNRMGRAHARGPGRRDR